MLRVCSRPRQLSRLFWVQLEPRPVRECSWPWRFLWIARERSGTRAVFAVVVFAVVLVHTAAEMCAVCGVRERRRLFNPQVFRAAAAGLRQRLSTSHTHLEHQVSPDACWSSDDSLRARVGLFHRLTLPAVAIKTALRTFPFVFPVHNMFRFR